MNLGGTEKSFLNLLESFPQDTEVDLLLLEKKGNLLERVPNNVKVITIENNITINELIKLGSRRFGFRQLTKGNVGLFLRSEIQFLLEKLKLIQNPYWAIQAYLKPLEENYDISIAYAGIHNFIAHYILHKTQARKKVLWIHFDIDNVISNFSFGKKYYPYFNQIFCVAENATNIFKKRFPATNDNVFTFNNIINAKSLLKEAKIAESYNDEFQGVRILTLGRLSKEKGQLFIPNIVKRLKGKNIIFRWYLIGEGKLTPLLNKEIKTLSIDNELILLGSKINPYGYLKDCDIYVQTSFHEGDPVVLREAKVFNKPVITTNFLSASNLITHNEDGLITEISEEGIYQGVKMLLENETLRKKFSTSHISETDVEKNIDHLLTIN